MLLVREQSARMYHIWAYYIGKFCSELLFDIVFPTISTFITYFMVNLNPGLRQLLVFWLVMVLMLNVGSSVGIFMGCLFPDAQTAVSLAPITIIPFMLFGGFFVSLSTITPALRWIAVHRHLDHLSFCAVHFPISMGLPSVCRQVRVPAQLLQGLLNTVVVSLLTRRFTATRPRRSRACVPSPTATSACSSWT